METMQPLVVLDTSRSPVNIFADATSRSGIGQVMRPIKPVNSSAPPATRTQGIQTDYMEREAQTDPYTPEYVVKPGEQPEVLTLATLMYRKFNDGKHDVLTRSKIHRWLCMNSMILRERSTGWSC
jgi:hypothetical protein